MDRISAAGFVVNPATGKRGFVNENLAAGVDGTDVDSVFLEGVQEEVIGVIEGAAIVPDVGNNLQLLAAIKHLIISGYTSRYNYSGGGSPGLAGFSFWRIEPDGFVTQGGYVDNPGSNNVGVQFPLPFPSGQLPVITVTCANSVTTANGIGVYMSSASSFAISQTQQLSFFWEAKWK